MPVCPMCRRDNPMGRLFCINCGHRLTIQEITHSQLMADGRKRWGGARAVGGGVLVLVLGALALALWPRPAPLGDPGTLPGAQRTSVALRALHVAGGVSELGRDFSEADLNAFLQQRGERLGGMWVSLDLKPRRVRLRGIRAFALPPVQGVSWKPVFSADLRLRADGERVSVVGGAVGHLPLPGPLALPLAGLARRYVAQERELTFLQNLRCLTAADGRLDLVVGR